MLECLSLEEFLELSKQNKPIAVFKEIASDLLTPISAFYSLSQGRKQCVLLESGLVEKDVGRFSFLGFDPIARFSSKSGVSESNVQGKKQVLSGNVLENLRNVLALRRCAKSARLPPLAGGAFGYLTYDAIRIFEKIPDRHPDKEELPDILFQFYETMVVFNHLKDTISIAIIVEPGENPRENYQAALKKIDQVIKEISHSESFKRRPATQPQPAKVDVDDDEYCKMIEQGKQHLLSGDAFQIVLSRSFTSPVTAPPFEIYRALKLLSPSPFMFFIQEEGYTLLGSSPERLVRLENGFVDTMPVAETLPCEKGALMAEDLFNNEIVLCKHVMLVDLGRSDIGKISKAGTVSVKELKTIKRFDRVMRLVSKMEGEIKEGMDALDAIQAVFPAGTLSGAPKIRAMEIIDALETSRRGFYGGALCIIDTFGNLDSCLATRLALIKNGSATIRAGTGIVLDSDPKNVVKENRNTASALLEAIQFAEEGKI